MFDNKPLNALLDTGASCSIIHFGTIQSLGLDMNIIESTHDLIDASGNNMNIAGSININLQLKGTQLIQNMKVLNSKTFRNVILGRDFLSHFRTVEFDFANKSIKLNNIWCSYVDIKRMEPVRLHTKTSIPSRFETVVQVKCKKSLALITADFEPTAVPSKPGIYPTYCRVIPNIEGVFYISLLNVTDVPIDLDEGQHIGHLTTILNSISVVQPTNSAPPVNSDQIVFGTQLSSAEKRQISSLIFKYQDVFASNPKKPNRVRNMEHRIITSNAQPVHRKPYRIPYAWQSEVDKQI